MIENWQPQPQRKMTRTERRAAQRAILNNVKRTLKKVRRQKEKE